MRIRSNHQTGSLIAILVLFIAACTPAAAPAVPTVTEIVKASPTPDAGLLLVIQTENGVEILQAKSGERTAVLSGIPGGQRTVLFTPDNPEAPSGRFALLDSQDLTLRFFQLPDRNPAKELSLLSHSELDEEKREAYQSALVSTAPPAFAWSPDGNAAVFLAASDHPYLELYHYDNPTGNITRLSDGSMDAYQPSWSPDSRWVVYNETDGLNTIGVWAVTAVKAVRANASQAVTLYEPQSYAETRIGWPSPTEFIVHSARDRGPVDLREVSLNGGESSIFSGVFSSPVFEPASGQTVFILSGSFSDTEAQPPGIYKASKSQPPVLLAPGIWNSLEWSSAAGAFLAMEATNGSAAISPSGQAVFFPGEETLPVVSVKGDLFAFAGGGDSARPGLRIYSGKGDLISESTSAPVESMWKLPDDRLVYSQGGNLFLLESFSSQPALLAEKAVFLGWLNNASIP